MFQDKKKSDESKSKDETQLSPEQLFINIYSTDDSTKRILKSDLNKISHFFEERVKEANLIPESDVIQDYNIFTIPDYLGIVFQKDSQIFFSIS